MLSKIKGNKTYALGVGLLGYLAVCLLTQTEVDQNIVNALLGGGLITLRAGIG